MAKRRSSGENSRPRIALLCGRNVRYASENAGLPFLALSRILIPPSSSPIAIKEFAATLLIIYLVGIEADSLLQLAVQKGTAFSSGSPTSSQKCVSLELVKKFEVSHCQSVHSD